MRLHQSFFFFYFFLEASNVAVDANIKICVLYKPVTVTHLDKTADSSKSKVCLQMSVSGKNINSQNGPNTPKAVLKNPVHRLQEKSAYRT